MTTSNETEPAFDAREAATAYLTPRGRRRIFRQLDVPFERIQVPFKDGHVALRSWGEGRLVLLVHGWSGCQSDMFDFVPALVESGFRAITMDLPAHGESTGVSASLNDTSAALIKVVETLGTVSGIIAHSFGCPTTAFAMSQGLSVGKLVFIASPQSYEAFARGWAAGKGFDEDQADALIETLIAAGVTVKVFTSEIVKQFSVPGLMIYSADDNVTLPVNGRRIADNWKGCEYVEFQGLGHRNVLKDPDVIQRVVEFLQKSD